MGAVVTPNAAAIIRALLSGSARTRGWMPSASHSTLPLVVLRTSSVLSDAVSTSVPLQGRPYRPQSQTLQARKFFGAVRGTAIIIEERRTEVADGTKAAMPLAHSRLLPEHRPEVVLRSRAQGRYDIMRQNRYHCQIIFSSVNPFLYSDGTSPIPGAIMPEVEEVIPLGGIHAQNAL